MTKPTEKEAREAWATLQAVRTECEIRIRRADHRPLIATLCYDPDKRWRPFSFGFFNSRGPVDELPFFMLCKQAVAAAGALGIGGVLPRYLKATGQWCLLITQIMPLPHPLHHGVWVDSEEIDTTDQVFDEFPDVFAMTAQAIGFLEAKVNPPRPHHVATWVPLPTPPEGSGLPKVRLELISKAAAAELGRCDARTIRRRVADGTLTEYEGGAVSKSEVIEKRLLLKKRWADQADLRDAAEAELSQNASRPPGPTSH